MEEDFSFIAVGGHGGLCLHDGKGGNLLLEPKGASLLGVKLLLLKASLSLEGKGAFRDNYDTEGKEA